MDGDDLFDPLALDPEDPFEIDEGNEAKLYGHPPFGPSDVYDVYFGAPLFYEYTGQGSAEWLMVGEVPGGFPEPSPARFPVVLRVALCRSGTQGKCRPVSIVEAGVNLRTRYLEER